MGISFVKGIKLHLRRVLSGFVIIEIYCDQPLTF